MKRFSYAKINIGLDILSEREDGYHNIDTIFQKISLRDEIFFEKSDSTEIICEQFKTLKLEDNLMVKAQKILEDSFGFRMPFRAVLKKEIPISSGLAGGSSNASETFFALNELYNLNLTKDELLDSGRKVGADVPFFISGYSTAKAKGIGEKLSPFENNLSYKILLINPDIKISTEEAYNSIPNELYGKINIDEISESLKLGKIPDAKNLNLMEHYAFNKYESLPKLSEELTLFGAKKVFMSGSGATLVALFKNFDISELKAKFPNFWIREVEFI